MDVTTIPFNAFLGIARVEGSAETQLCLPASPEYTNHLGTVHASVQFALGEACSGECLLRAFRTILTQYTVVPVVRKVEVKYKKPAQGAIVAHAMLADQRVQQVVESLERKHRASIPVDVTITDEHRQATMTATYHWFVQIVDTSS